MASFTRLSTAVRLLILVALITAALPAQVTGCYVHPAARRSIHHHCACKISPNSCSLKRRGDAYSSSSMLLFMIFNHYTRLTICVNKMFIATG